MSIYENLRFCWRKPIPDLLVGGYSGSGKATFCEILADLGLTFTNTTSMICDALFREGLTEEHLFPTKDRNRIEIYNAVSQFNLNDPTKMAREILNFNDVYCGMRNKETLYACYNENIFDLTIWIENPRVSREVGSCTVNAEDFDIIIYNGGSRFDLIRRAERLIQLIRS